MLDLFGAASTFLAGLGGTIIMLVPGYVIGKTFSRGVRGPELSDQAFVATAAVGGILTHAVALPFTVRIARDFIAAVPTNDTGTYVPLAAWAILVLLIVPATIGALAARVADSQTGPIHSLLTWYGVSSEQRAAEAWNWIFSGLSRDGKARWLQVRKKNGGGTYLGLFAGQSLVSSDARVRDVFLEYTWDLDGNGRPKATNTPNAGVWISGDEISSIEFFPVKESEDGTKDQPPH